jgi:hypothetical protein
LILFAFDSFGNQIFILIEKDNGQDEQNARSSQDGSHHERIRKTKHENGHDRRDE